MVCRDCLSLHEIVCLDGIVQAAQLETGHCLLEPTVANCSSRWVTMATPRKLHSLRGKPGDALLWESWYPVLSCHLYEGSNRTLLVQKLL